MSVLVTDCAAAGRANMSAQRQSEGAPNLISFTRASAEASCKTRSDSCLVPDSSTYRQGMRRSIQVIRVRSL